MTTIADFRDGLDADTRSLVERLLTALAETDEIREARAQQKVAQLSLWKLQESTWAMPGLLADAASPKHRRAYLERAGQLRDVLERPHRLRLRQLDGVVDLARDLENAAALCDVLPTLAGSAGAAHEALAAYRRAHDKAIADLELLQRQRDQAELELRQLRGESSDSAHVDDSGQTRSEPSVKITIDGG